MFLDVLVREPKFSRKIFISKFIFYFQDMSSPPKLSSGIAVGAVKLSQVLVKGGLYIPTQKYIDILVVRID